ncbi:MAG: hypothetical protein U0894_05795 [Pirellulales bacterium]
MDRQQPVAQEASPAALMKLLKSGKLPAERQATVVEMICKRGNGRPCLRSRTTCQA